MGGSPLRGRKQISGGSSFILLQGNLETLPKSQFLSLTYIPVVFPIAKRISVARSELEFFSESEFKILSSMPYSPSFT